MVKKNNIKIEIIIIKFSRFLNSKGILLLLIIKKKKIVIKNKIDFIDTNPLIPSMKLKILIKRIIKNIEQINKIKILIFWFISKFAKNNNINEDIRLTKNWKINLVNELNLKKSSIKPIKDMMNKQIIKYISLIENEEKYKYIILKKNKIKIGNPPIFGVLSLWRLLALGISLIL